MKLLQILLHSILGALVGLAAMAALIVLSFIFPVMPYDQTTIFVELTVLVGGGVIIGGVIGYKKELVSLNKLFLSLTGIILTLGSLALTGWSGLLRSWLKIDVYSAYSICMILLWIGIIILLVQTIKNGNLGLISKIFLILFLILYALALSFGIMVSFQ